MLTRLNLCTKEELMKDLKYGRDIGFVEMAEGLSGKVEKLKNGRMEKVIEVADGERVVIREEEFLTESLVQVRLKICAGAKVTYVCSVSATVFNSVLSIDRVADVGRNAELVWTGVVAAGGEDFVQSYCETKLTGENAKVKYLVGVRAVDSAKVDVLNRVVHVGIGTSCLITTRAVADDAAKVVIRDAVVIGEGVNGCNAEQESKILLLSKSASCQAVPQLEIANDKVSARHRASISRLDVAQIFALTSRGVNAVDARKIIVDGFFADMVDEEMVVDGRLENLRNDFLMLRPDENGRVLAYLDSAASSLTPEPVILAMDEYYREYRANVHRGLYTASEKASTEYELARVDVAKFIGAHTEEVVFTSGTTDGLNKLARMLEDEIVAGDEILITEMEHHANMVPWQELAKRSGAVLRYIPVTDDGCLDMSAFSSMINDRTKIVSCVWGSNVLGTINPIEEIVKLARENSEAVVVVDAAQMMLHASVDVRKLDVDFLVFSGHKMFGPTGVGVLYGKSKHLEKLNPVFFGGDMIHEVNFQNSTWAESPRKFEAGTPNISGVIGLGAAVRYLQGLDRGYFFQKERVLTEYAIELLKSCRGVEVVGPVDLQDRLGVISFTVSGVHPHDLATVLDIRGVAVRAGFHCAMPLMKKMSCQNGTTRLSIAPYTTNEDIERLLAGIRYAQELLCDKSVEK